MGAAATRFADYLCITVHDDGEENIDHGEAHEQEKHVLVDSARNRVNSTHLFPQCGVADGHVEQCVKCISYRLKLGHLETEHNAAHDCEAEEGYHEGDREMEQVNRRLGECLVYDVETFLHLLEQIQSRKKILRRTCGELDNLQAQMQSHLDEFEEAHKAHHHIN